MPLCGFYIVSATSTETINHMFTPQTVYLLPLLLLLLLFTQVKTLVIKIQSASGLAKRDLLGTR